MRTTRVATKLSSVFVLAFFFACAGGEDKAADPAQPPPPEQSLDGGASDAPRDAPPAAKKCSDDGFCYLTVPGTRALLGVSASSPDDAWMIPEESGALLRWNGTSIAQVYEYERANPPKISWNGIWAEKRDDVWAIARGSDDRMLVVRYASPLSGGAPEFRELSTTQPAAYSASLWGTPSSDAVWLASSASVLRIRENAAGAVVEDLTPSSGPGDQHGYLWLTVWGFGPDDVYAGGRQCPSSPCFWDETAVLAHYNGSAWSITSLAPAAEVASLRGTPPGTPRHLWYATSVRNSRGDFVATTHLAAVGSDGALGEPTYTRDEVAPPPCGTRVGRATTDSTGWFSSGTLLCHWDGMSLEPVRTVLGDRPIIDTLRGVWAAGTDDVWIVGAAVTRSGLPPTAFAARRTAETAAAAKTAAGAKQ